MEYITTPTVSEILREEFMEPLHFWAYCRRRQSMFLVSQKEGYPA